MSYVVRLTARQLETVENALVFYEREMLHNSPYNNLTKTEEVAERRVVAKTFRRIEIARGDDEWNE